MREEGFEPSIIDGAINQNLQFRALPFIFSHKTLPNSSKISLAHELMSRSVVLPDVSWL